MFEAPKALLIMPPSPSQILWTDLLPDVSYDFQHRLTSSSISVEFVFEVPKALLDLPPSAS